MSGHASFFHSKSILGNILRNLSTICFARGGIIFYSPCSLLIFAHDAKLSRLARSEIQKWRGLAKNCHLKSDYLFVHAKMSHEET